MDKLLLVALCFIHLTLFARGSQFIVDVLNIGKCSNEGAWRKGGNKATHAHVWTVRATRNSQVFGLSVNTTAPVGPIKLNFRIYKLDDAQKSMLFEFNGMSCENKEIFSLVRQLGVPLDEQCVLPAGALRVEAADAALLERFLVSVHALGLTPRRQSIEIDILDRKGLIFCVELDMDVSLQEQ